MKKGTRLLWGILLVAVGVVLALNVLEITHVDLLFDGWWTLLIIVPCLVGLLNGGNRKGNLFGLLIGMVLLLSCRGLIPWNLIWKLLLPAFVVLLGLGLIFRNRLRRKAGNGFHVSFDTGFQGGGECFSLFSDQDLRFDGQVFHGTRLTSIFGGIRCDLRNAIIEEDVRVDVSCVFGGVDILVPAGINVKHSVTSVFGGVDSRCRDRNLDAPTVYITGACVFGGVDIR